MYSNQANFALDERNDHINRLENKIIIDVIFERGASSHKKYRRSLFTLFSGASGLMENKYVLGYTLVCIHETLLERIHRISTLVNNPPVCFESNCFAKNEIFELIHSLQPIGTPTRLHLLKIIPTDYLQ